MSDDDLKRQLEITFEPYVKKEENPDGFLDMKGFHRVGNAEMRAEEIESRFGTSHLVQ